MTEILTTNELSPIHGILPTTERDASGIERGFVVYLEVGGPTNGLFARTFWTKYNHNGAPNNQREFVRQILALAATGNMDKLELHDEPYNPAVPHAFRDDISEIRFGWKPINVSYVLNSAYVKIQPLDGAKPLQQPLVFRRNKVVKGDREDYLANHSFFNLEYYVSDKATILEFSNFMIVDELGAFIGEEPTDISERERQFYPYCLDIPMDFDQEAILALFSMQVSASENEKAPRDSGILNTITFVFDPPQGNGGGGGVPSQP